MASSIFDSPFTQRSTLSGLVRCLVKTSNSWVKVQSTYCSDSIQMNWINWSFCDFKFWKDWTTTLLSKWSTNTASFLAVCQRKLLSRFLETNITTDMIIDINKIRWDLFLINIYPENSHRITNKPWVNIFSNIHTLIIHEYSAFHNYVWKKCYPNLLLKTESSVWKWTEQTKWRHSNTKLKMQPRWIHN